MTDTGIAKTIAELASPLAASLGLDIWGVEAAFGKRGIVRVFVEGENGVNIDACAELSRLLGLSLDVEDIFPGAYVLEVSSPGLERVFFSPEQLAGYVGKTVEATLHAPPPDAPGRKKLLGTLTESEKGTFAILLLDAPKESTPEATAPIRFTWDDVKKAKLVHFLPETENASKGKKPKQTKISARAAQKKPGGSVDEETTA